MFVPGFIASALQRLRVSRASGALQPGGSGARQSPQHQPTSGAFADRSSHKGMMCRCIWPGPHAGCSPETPFACDAILCPDLLVTKKDLSSAAQTATACLSLPDVDRRYQRAGQRHRTDLSAVSAAVRTVPLVPCCPGCCTGCIVASCWIQWSLRFKSWLQWLTDCTAGLWPREP